MVRRVINGLEQPSLGETKLKRAEFAREQLDDVCNLRRWEKETVNSMNDAVGTELKLVSSGIQYRRTRGIQS